MLAESDRLDTLLMSQKRTDRSRQSQAQVQSAQAERAERVSARVEPSVIARFFVTTSRVSQSLLSDVSRVVVVSSVSQPVSSIAVLDLITF